MKRFKDIIQQLWENDKGLILILTIIGIFLRLYRLTYYDIWYDEASSFFNVMTNLKEFNDINVL